MKVTGERINETMVVSVELSAGLSCAWNWKILTPCHLDLLTQANFDILIASEPQEIISRPSNIFLSVASQQELGINTPISCWFVFHFPLTIQRHVVGLKTVSFNKTKVTLWVFGPGWVLKSRSSHWLNPQNPFLLFNEIAWPYLQLQFFMQFELVYCVWLQLQNSLSPVGIVHPLSWNRRRFPRRQNVNSPVWHLVAAAKNSSCVTEKSSRYHKFLSEMLFRHQRMIPFRNRYKVRPGGEAAAGTRTQDPELGLSLFMCCSISGIKVSLRHDTAPNSSLLRVIRPRGFCCSAMLTLAFEMSSMAAAPRGLGEHYWQQLICRFLFLNSREGLLWSCSRNLEISGGAAKFFRLLKFPKSSPTSFNSLYFWHSFRNPVVVIVNTFSENEPESDQTFPSSTSFSDTKIFSTDGFITHSGVSVPEEMWVKTAPHKLYCIPLQVISGGGVMNNDRFGAQKDKRCEWERKEIKRRNFFFSSFQMIVSCHSNPLRPFPHMCRYQASDARGQKKRCQGVKMIWD